MKVCVTRKIPGPAIDLLQQAGFEVVVNSEDKVLTPEQLKKFVFGTDAILALLTDKITSEVLEAAGPQLKIVANYAVGFDNVDLITAKQKNIFVTNTPDVLTEAVAEHTLALMLAVARKIVQADKYVREGKFLQWEPEMFLGMELKGKTLGIIGMGRIGITVAKAAKMGFGMKIAYHSHKKNDEMDPTLEAEFFDDLEKMLANVDVVSLHVPLTPDTKHMMSRRELSAMKKTGVLINTARGPIIDETALVEALTNNAIGGAGLDVFEDETKKDEALYKLSNVTLTPHIASATVEARNEMSRMAAENITAALMGKTPSNLAK